MAIIQETGHGAVRSRRAARKMGPLPKVITLAAVAVLGWWGWVHFHTVDSGTAGMITAPVTRGDLIESISATGSVTAQTGALVKIGSQITGRIKRLYADVGSEVKAGHVIAELDLPDIQAQLDQANANLAGARTKVLQQQSGQGMEQTQTSSAITGAQAALNSAEARLGVTVAAAQLQTVQTPQDIKRAQTVLAAAQSALGTAKSNLAQVQAGANLQVANTQEVINQAQANADNSATNLKRQQSLELKGFVATAVVDTARAQSEVYQSQVKSAHQNLELVQQKVAADLQAARDQVVQAQQNVEAARAALTSAQAGPYQNNEKAASVRDAQAQVRQARAALMTAQANTSQNVLKVQDIQQAQDAAASAQAQVAYYRAQLDKTLIRSPISGTVLQMAAQQGETLAAGLSAPTLIVVADLHRLQVDAFVDETDIGKVKLNQEADITVDAFPKSVFKGHVSKIASGSTIQQGVVTYDVTIALDDKTRQLKPDMTASVTIQTGSRTNVLLVPSEAIKAGKRGGSVNLMTKRNGVATIEQRKVKTGGTDGVNTEIRDGLKEGDIVVLAGMPSGQKRQGPASPFGPGAGRRGG